MQFPYGFIPLFGVPENVSKIEGTLNDFGRNNSTFMGTWKREEVTILDV
jgi:hypothetical protein